MLEYRCGMINFVSKPSKRTDKSNLHIDQMESDTSFPVSFYYVSS